MQAWMLEEMARAMQAERLAEAERYRMATSVPGSYSSPRMQLARALRALATLVDDETNGRAQPKRRLVGAL
jgi:hypothetical protein